MEHIRMTNISTRLQGGGQRGGGVEKRERNNLLDNGWTHG